MRDDAKKATRKRPKPPPPPRPPAPRQSSPRDAGAQSARTHAQPSRAHTRPPPTQSPRARPTSSEPAPDKIPQSTSHEPRGEFDFITRLRRRALREHGDDSPTPTPDTRHPTPDTRLSSPSPQPPTPAPLLGIGDDAAVFRAAARHDTVVTADLLVEDVDFSLRWAAPDALGHKALAVSLSDIAAMGARPRWSLLSVGVPARVWDGPFLEQFYEGYFKLARLHGVALVGGDVSRTPERVVFDSVVIGEALRGRAVTRAGARAGDQIFVTGWLGGASAGLRILQTDHPHGPSAPRTRLGPAARELVGRQLRPAPRVAWGALLGERRLATAMIDLSDGLSSDLAHLCRESGVGALLRADSLPLHPRLAGRSAARILDRHTTQRRYEPGAQSHAEHDARGRDEQDARAYAEHGGEDFELLFTVRPRDVGKLPASLGGVPVTRVGEIRPRRSGVKIVRDGRAQDFRPRGFDHFAGAGKFKV
jgi:thiamine-monophosphate kinase